MGSNEETTCATCAYLITDEGEPMQDLYVFVEPTDKACREHTEARKKEITINIEMNDSVRIAAMKADGNSQRCLKCPYRPCSDTQFRICTVAFREGFRKGAAWKAKQLKSKNK